jgi:hypothetical protein
VHEQTLSRRQSLLQAAGREPLQVQRLG